VLKKNYRIRIQEADDFSKRFSNSSADFRSQYMKALNDFLEYYVDLQNKFTGSYPTFYKEDLMIKQSDMITKAWVSLIRSMDLFYSSFLEYAIKNMRVFNQGFIQMIQITEMIYDIGKSVPLVQRNTLVELIKEAKKYNDIYSQKQLAMKKISSSHKRIQKKQVTGKEL